MLFTLARRNIFRNRRRTLITASSIALAVMTAVCMKSIQQGAWNNMIDGVVKYYVGYAQIHKNGYWKDKTIDQSFEFNTDVADLPKTSDEIELVVPRLESFALAAHDQKSRGILVVGIDPMLEDQLTNLKEKVVEGAYIDQDDHGAMIGSGLADLLDVGIQDTFILLSQGYRGATAAGIYPVKALLQFGSPQLNKQMVYLSLPAANEFYATPDLVTSVAIDISAPEKLPIAMASMRSNLDTVAYEVMDYQEMLPELMQAKAVDTVGNSITLWILYLIIAFGLFGTILMMVKERTYEFGVLLSIGMPRAKLCGVLWMETLLLGLFGALLGMLISFPIVWWFHNNPIELTGQAAQVYDDFGVSPIFPAALDFSIFAEQGLVIFIMASLMVIYPLFKVYFLKPIKAMRA